jgi:hypothetical protein
VQLKSHIAGSRSVGGALQILVPPVEVTLTEDAPEPAVQTCHMKVLDQPGARIHSNCASPPPGGTTQTLLLRQNATVAHLAVQGGELKAAHDGLQELQVLFDPASGYLTKTVTLTW